jgi:hypothetical protein
MLIFLKEKFHIGFQGLSDCTYENIKKDLLPVYKRVNNVSLYQSYEIKSTPLNFLWFRILEIFSVENIARLGAFMFQTSDNSQFCIDS